MIPGMKSPFKFLDSYTKDDREVFFGREREIEELYHRVFESKIMLVYGVSGTGKSSLIHCGLANKFQDTDWLPLVIRHGGNIIESMSAAIKAASITAQQAHLVTPPDFKKGVRSLYLDYYKPVFFIFDQFEELFIFGDKEERRTFIHIVKTLTESDLQCRMIFVMREEYMAGVSEFEKFIPTFFSNRVRIEKMSHRNAIEAIKGPCKVFNISLEEGFAESLLEKLSPGSEDVELTYMQVFLDKIFRLAFGLLPPPGGESKGGSAESKGELSFTLPLLQKTGNVSDLLGSFLDEQIALLHDPDSGLAVLKSFVSVIGTKRQMSPEEVSEYSRTLGKQITESGVQELLQTFIQLRILRDKDENGKYELRHDALATKIYEKISLVEKEILEIRQFIENAHNNYQRRGVLLSADDLDYIAPYESRLYLPDDLRILINKSHTELLKTKRRRRVIASASVLILLIVFAGFSIWALMERNKSKKQEVIAKANFYSSLSKEYAGSDPTKALWLAEYATYLNPTEENRRNLVNIYSVNEFYDVFMPVMLKNLKTSYSFRIFPKSGKIALPEEGRILISDTTGKIFETFPIGYAKRIYSYEISQDGKYFLTRLSDDTVTVFDMSGKKLVKVKSPFDGVFYDFRIPNMLFLPDSKSFLTTKMTKEISVWSVDGSLLTRSDVFENYSYPIITSSSDKILVCSNNGSLYRWNLNTNEISRTKLQLSDSTYVRNPPVITSDGRIALYRTDKKLCIYDTTGRCVNSWQIDYAPVNIISALNKNMIITFNEDLLDLWDYNGKNVKRIKCNSTISDVQYSPEQNQVLFSTQNRIMAVRIEKSKDSLVLKTRNNAIFNSNRNILVELQKSNKQVNVYDENGNFQKNIRLNGDCENPCLSFSGNFLALQNNSKPYLTITDLRNGDSFNLDSLDSRPYSITFSNTDKYFATSGKILTSKKYDGLIIAVSDANLNIRTLEGKLIRTIDCGEDVACFQFFADDKSIIAASGYNAFLWDTAGQKTCTYSGHAGLISSLDISFGGRYVLTGAYDGTTRLWSADGNVLRILHTHEMGNQIEVSFLDNKSSFMVYDQREIKIYSFEGVLLQTIPIRTFSNLPLTSYFSSANNAVLYSDSEKGGLYRIKLKAPLDTFIISSNHNDLFISDKIMYGIVSVNELLSSRNNNDLYFAGIYLMYWKTRGVLDLDELKNILSDAEKLFRRALKYDPSPPGRIYQKLTEIYLQKNQLFDENIGKYLDNFFTSIITSNDINELTDALNFYYSMLDGSTIQYGFAEKALGIFKKILNQRPDISKILASEISNMSWELLELKSFKTALDAALVSLKADKSNPYVITNLAPAYIFNNQYSEAEKAYNEWKNKPWTASAEFTVYRDAFLDDLRTLEEKGIIHPDFEKVKELLKE